MSAARGVVLDDSLYVYGFSGADLRRAVDLGIVPARRDEQGRLRLAWADLNYLFFPASRSTAT